MIGGKIRRISKTDEANYGKGNYYPPRDCLR